MKPLFRTDPEIQDSADRLVQTVTAKSPHMSIGEALKTAGADAWHNRNAAPTLPRAMFWDLVHVELHERARDHEAVAA